jgi:hypothetical protein
VSRVQELESRLRRDPGEGEGLAEGPCQVLSRDIRGQGPWTKRNPPSLLIELNPVDENNLPTKRRGLYIRSRRDLEEYRKLINDRSLDALVSALEEVNGRREEEEGESQDLEI